MAHNDLCSTLAGRLAELLDPAARGADLERLRTHAATCSACSDLIARQAALTAELTSLGACVPPPPPGFRAPELRGPAPVLRLRWAAAAAVMLAAGLVAGVVAREARVFTSGAPSDVSTDVTTEAGGRPVEIRSIQDAPSSLAVPDEELLRLSCGWDGVASLRPALDQ